jgi:hypothetical protein
LDFGSPESGVIGSRHCSHQIGRKPADSPNNGGIEVAKPQGLRVKKVREETDGKKHEFQGLNFSI